MGGNGLAQTHPGHHTIHLGRGIPRNLGLGVHSQAKPCFSGVPKPRASIDQLPPAAQDFEKNGVPRIWGPKWNKLHPSGGRRPILRAHKGPIWPNRTWDLGTNLGDLGTCLGDLGTNLWDLGTNLGDLGTNLGDLGTNLGVLRPWARDQGPGPGTGTRDQGPGTRGQGPGTRGQGPGTRDQGPGIVKTLDY